MGEASGRAFFLDERKAYRRTCDLLYALHLLNLCAIQQHQHAERDGSASPILLRFSSTPPLTLRFKVMLHPLEYCCLTHLLLHALEVRVGCTHTTQDPLISSALPPVTSIMTLPEFSPVSCCIPRPPLSLLTSPLQCLVSISGN